MWILRNDPVTSISSLSWRLHTEIAHSDADWGVSCYLSKVEAIFTHEQTDSDRVGYIMDEGQ